MPAARRPIPAARTALLALGCVALGACARPAAPAADARPVADSADDHPAQKIRAVHLDARRAVPEAFLDTLRAWGVSHVVVCPYGFQETATSPAIRQHDSTGTGWYSESDAGIRALAAGLQARGMAVVLKPHLWVGRGTFTGEIAMGSEADWRAWEASYRAYALRYARLSAAVGAPLYVIGTELGAAVRARPAFWRRLIGEVRAVYPGRLTYAANWHGDAEHVAFWDVLDYVGVQAYFPLAGPTTPAGLARAWRPHLATLERLGRRAGRPVLLTELGYRSVAYAAREPWRWPERTAEPADPALQARLYDAALAALWDRPWFAGLAVWKVSPDPDRRPDRHAADFSPQGKPAETVLRRRFAGR